MVSSALNMTLDELLRVLRRIRREHATEPAYKAWRKNFPESWPM